MKALQVRAGANFTMVANQPTAAVFVVRPEQRIPQRVLWESWETEPFLPYRDYVDPAGNRCRRLTLPAGRFELAYDVLAETTPHVDESDTSAVEHHISDVPDEALVYTLPSRFCLSDLLFDRAWQLFGGIAPGWGRVQAISDWVHDNINFAYGSSTGTTTALDVLNAGYGVCRDFAHVMIAFCRALNIPTRYAFGYLPDIDVPPPYTTMDFCAWCEVYLGGRWWVFDPRNNQRRKGRITIARGRDALDVAMVTTFGQVGLEEMTVHADPEDVAAELLQPNV
jgi:transglutaminase-like putative cysteine protease